MTASRAVMGTLAYMAPEQREGKTCTAETDIYSVGLILYEMATGRRFSQDAGRLLNELPKNLTHVIECCVASDPEQRWHSARDVKLELKWTAHEPTASSSSGPGSLVTWAVVIVLGFLGSAGVLFGVIGRGQPSRVVVPSRLAITAPQGADLREGVAISPDGRNVVFVAQSAGTETLWLRPLDSLAARELPGTEGATYPFWSPDSRSVAFFAVGKLKRIDVNSGASTAICDIGLVPRRRGSDGFTRRLSCDQRAADKRGRASRARGRR